MDFEEETLEIEICENFLPYVYIEVEGKPVPFLVDTGSVYSALCLEQIKRMGYDESDLKDVPSDEQSDFLGFLPAMVKLSNIKMKMDLEVCDAFSNLLGQDILAGLCCRIDMISMKLTLREFSDNFIQEHTRTMVKVQGKDVEMVVDTGFMGFMTGPLSLAQELGLPLQENNVQILGVGYEGIVKQIAKNLRMEAAGHEESNAEYYVFCDETPKNVDFPIIGSRFLYGMQLQYNVDGSFEMSGRGMDIEWDAKTRSMLREKFPKYVR